MSSALDKVKRSKAKSTRQRDNWKFRAKAYQAISREAIDLLKEWHFLSKRGKAVGLSEFVEKVRQGKCPFCGKMVDIGEFRDLISLREFEISGICQKCQDKTFDNADEN